MSYKSTMKTMISFLSTILAVPLIILLTLQFGPRKYYLISFAVVLLAILSFFLSFENRKPQAKEIVVIAVMSSIAVAGRAAFIAVPFFKPVAGIVIITGVALGAQAGFLCGSISMLVSNFIFGQGSWTPWQMAAFGAIGFLSGLVFYKKPVRQRPICIAISGAFLVMLVVGPILDMSGLFMATQMPDTAAAIGVLMAGLPVNAIQACSTLFFVLVLAKPILEKLDRIKIKYGMME